MTSTKSGESGRRSVPTKSEESGRRSVPTLTVYSKPDCHLCEEAIATLRRLREEFPFELLERDITLDDAMHRAYFERIPVVEIDGQELCEYFVQEALVRKRLESRR